MSKQKEKLLSNKLLKFDVEAVEKAIFITFVSQEKRKICLTFSAEFSQDAKENTVELKIKAALKHLGVSQDLSTFIYNIYKSALCIIN